VAGIAVTGLVSGLDVETIVSRLMQVERAPRLRLEMRQGQAKARQEALREIRAKLQAVADAAAALRSPGLWADTQEVSSTAPDAVGARRLAGAGPGGYAIEVTQLARAEQRTYDYTPPEAASQITINGVAIDVEAGASLADVVASINAAPETGVYAVEVGGRLVLSSRTTGAAATISAAGEGLVEDPSKLKVGLDAQFTVDGVAMSSASNVIEDAIPGLELTLKAVTAGPVTVTVGNPGADKEAIEKAVRGFIDAYNAAVDLVRQKLSEERVAKPANQSEANRGVLFADGQLGRLLSELRRVVSEAGLDTIGVSTGKPGSGGGSGSPSLAGKLELDAAKLADALADDPLAVRKLVAGAEGFVASLEAVLKPTVGVDGTLSQRLDAIAAESKRLSDAMARLDMRLARQEERLHAQFAALESLLSRSQAQSEWLNGQLAAFYA